MKFDIEAAAIQAFLQTRFSKHINSVSPIGTGMFSQAFAFDLKSQAFIIRINAYEIDFRKDAFAAQHFATSSLPIPKVIQIGRFDQTRHFAITERCQGTTLDQINKQKLPTLTSSLFNTLAAIQQVDVSHYSGWGLMDGAGQGQFQSWAAYLMSLHNPKFTINWTALAQHTFLEWEVYQAWLNEMQQRLPYCPAQKYLVHGDFGAENVMAAQQITGVLDWAESRLGDFVYDIAYLNFWSEALDYSSQWQAWSASQGHQVHHFKERMQCYTLHIGLGSLAIAAIQTDQADYQWVKQRVQRLVGLAA